MEAMIALRFFMLPPYACRTPVWRSRLLCTGSTYFAHAKPASHLRCQVDAQFQPGQSRSHFVQSRRRLHSCSAVRLSYRCAKSIDYSPLRSLVAPSRNHAEFDVAKLTVKTNP